MEDLTLSRKENEMPTYPITDRQVDEFLAQPHMKNLLSITSMKAQVKLLDSMIKAYNESDEDVLLSPQDVARGLQAVETALLAEIRGFQRAVR